MSYVPQLFWPVNVFRNSLIGTVGPLIPVSNRRNLQCLDRHFSVISILVRLHCTYDLQLCAAIVQLYRTYSLYYLVLRQRFGFVCILFVLFCCSDTNNPCPCITDTIWAIHHLPYPAAPQEPTVVLLFLRPLWRSRSGGC